MVTPPPPPTDAPPLTAATPNASAASPALGSSSPTLGTPEHGAIDLSATLGSLKLRYPTLTCSGTCGYAGEYADFTDLSKLGAFVTKSVTREERKGNPPTRIVEVKAGMLNAIGLANVGLKRFLAEKVPLIERMPCPTIVNVAGHSTDDYVEAVAAIAPLACCAAVELNVSCPNVKDGLTFGTSPARLRELIKQVRPAMANKPLIVKLSPNVDDVALTAAAAVEGGADVLSLVNTFTALAVDLKSRRPRLANVTGGLSGPAVKPVALQMTSRVYRLVAKPAGIPIIGMGGISNWQDAAEFVLCGASAVAVGTALFVDPATPERILPGLADYCASQGATRLSDLVGTLQV